MYITTHLLCRDTIKFLKVKWLTIFVIALFSSSITIMIDNIFVSNSNILTFFYESKMNQYYSLFDFVKALTPYQQKRLLLFSIMKLFSSLIGSTVLIGILTIFIKTIAFKKNSFLLELKKNNVFLFLNLFLLIFIITIIIQLGLMLLIIPGMMFCILLSLSPIILMTNNTTIIQSIISSTQITLYNFKIITPAIILWLLSKLVILILLSNIKIISGCILSLLLNTMTNIISSILIIYLFRFYMLSTSLSHSN
ncbi:hypothetical protein D9V73_01305 [Buchnera aphidicola (Melaphis rhois)]|uniref:UPF0259 membrane protein D9V73_01305 n=3 Tax=Buchnera aphidicola TaxID=9 RepID=A0A4D6YBA1_BUCMH|nr:hypothetical protein D9V73_01305 [Buchnera aphidicola (Melaphis rhois)]